MMPNILKMVSMIDLKKLFFHDLQVDSTVKL